MTLRVAHRIHVICILHVGTICLDDVILRCHQKEPELLVVLWRIFLLHRVNFLKIELG